MANEIKISRGDGRYGSSPYKPGSVIRNKAHRIEAGEPEFLYVLEAREQYYDGDGMSFGAGRDNGSVYSATCRPATDAESAPIQAAKAAKAPEQTTGRQLQDIFDQICRDGVCPAGQHEPKGARRMVDGDESITTGGGRWIVISQGRDHIWAIRNNGADGDDWSLNNVTTGGAGAIGYRVAHTPELALAINQAPAL